MRECFCQVRHSAVTYTNRSTSQKLLKHAVSENAYGNLEYLSFVSVCNDIVSCCKVLYGDVETSLCSKSTSISEIQLLKVVMGNSLRNNINFGIMFTSVRRTPI